MIKISGKILFEGERIGMSVLIAVLATLLALIAYAIFGNSIVSEEINVSLKIGLLLFPLFAFLVAYSVFYWASQKKVLFLIDTENREMAIVIKNRIIQIFSNFRYKASIQSRRSIDRYGMFSGSFFCLSIINENRRVFQYFEPVIDELKELSNVAINPYSRLGMVFPRTPRPYPNIIWDVFQTLEKHKNKTTSQEYK